MIRCALMAAFVAASSFVASGAAAQQLRSFPPNTLRGVLVVGDYPAVQMNRRTTQLSPGSRVRGPNNMTVTPTTLAGQKLLVHYTLDIGTDRIRDVWILTPDEAAIQPWPTTLDEARTWTWDQNTRTWTRP